MHGGPSIVVGELDWGRRAEWDSFVSAHDEGTVYHLSAWKRVFERAFRQRTYLLEARRGGRLAGVLPLVHIKSALFGNSLVSMGHLVYGGALADGQAAQNALDEAAIRLGEDLDVDYLEYRCRKPQHPDWPRREGRYATFRKTIAPDSETNLKSIPRKQRAVVRKGIKNGLVSETSEDVDTLHRIMAVSYRNLGTPSFPRRYFQILREELGDLCECLLIKHEGDCVAAVMSFYFKGEVAPYYGGGVAEARNLGANDFMYWEVMRRACERGCTLFDFGRSKVGTGAYNFKKYWGFEPEPLDYEFVLRKAHEIPDTSPLNPKYRHAIALWKRLPVALSMRIGPLIAKNLG